MFNTLCYTVLQRDLETAASLDVAIVLDCTGSMGGYIDAAKNNINGFVDSLSKIYPDIPLRIAFIGYRDHCDGVRRLAVLRFTKDLEEFRRFVASQPATGGGGDGPEDVFGALKVATTLEWASATRILYHIGDNACHGVEFHQNFHSGSGDHYPLGDPRGLKAGNLLTALQGLNRQSVQYFFGKITNYTDIMVAKFNEIVGEKYVETHKMNADTMVTVISSKSPSCSSCIFL